MSRYIRPKVPGASVFFTVALADRRAQTLVKHVDVLREAVRVTKAKRPFQIDAWVVLPDHMHAVWTLPEGDADFSGRWREIKGQFTMALRRSGRAPTRDALTDPAHNPYGAIGGRVRQMTGVGARPDLHKNEAPIWQKRFWEHHIRDEAAFAAYVEYCWMNPVKHGLVERPEDWARSSWWRDGV
jgi:putative transposase